MAERPQTARVSPGNPPQRARLSRRGRGFSAPGPVLEVPQVWVLTAGSFQCSPYLSCSTNQCSPPASELPFQTLGTHESLPSGTAMGREYRFLESKRQASHGSQWAAPRTLLTAARSPSPSAAITGVLRCQQLALTSQHHHDIGAQEPSLGVN